MFLHIDLMKIAVRMKSNESHHSYIGTAIVIGNIFVRNLHSDQNLG